MHRSNRQAFTSIVSMILDLLFSILAYGVAHNAVSMLYGVHADDAFIWALIIYFPVYFLSMFLMEMYEMTTFIYHDRVMRNVILSCLAASLFCVALLPFIKENRHNSSFLGIFILTAVFFIAMQRYVMLLTVGRYRKQGRTRGILVGSCTLVEKYIYYLKKTSMSINITGYIPLDEKGGTGPGKKLGRLDELEDILNRNVVDEVVFALPGDYMGEVERHVLLCESRGLTVRIVLNLYDLRISRSFVHSVGPMPVLTYHTISLNRYQLALKRCVDIAGSLVGIAITFVLSFAIVPAVIIDSGRPVLFRQKRVGQNGRVFMMYKFRSMCAGAEEEKKKLEAKNEMGGGLMFKIRNDPRITTVGKFLRRTSLDELPQFVNVLKGEMSLVGTRPPTVDEVEKYDSAHHRRISIKPGITGLWQTSGRSGIKDFDEIVRLDTQYIDSWSIWKDFLIIVRTLKTMFAHNRGAC